MTVLTNDPKPSLKSRMWQKLKPIPKQLPALDPFPEPWQCITHLKLMRMFSRLQLEIVNAFVQKPVLDSLIENKSGVQRQEAETSIRSQVWKMYLEQAADRFELWWRSIAPKDKAGRISQIGMSICRQPGELENMIRNTKPMVWTKENLPPLDVLMILHSYMLNPRCFLEDCLRHGTMPLWRAGMPWHILDQVLDTLKNEYAVPNATQTAWTKATGCTWNHRQAMTERLYVCPFCCASVKYQPGVTTPEFGPDGKMKELVAELTVSCHSCNTDFNIDQLRVRKFREGVLKLRQEGVPMMGTILNRHGLAKSSLRSGLDPELFALNRLLEGEIGKQILHITSPESMRNESKLRLSDLRANIEESVSCQNDPNLKLGIRRAFSQAADTPSMFSLDLAAAVVRQGVFIEQMEEIDWLHSPALDFTMEDLLQRYTVFFKIMGQNKDHVAVPTYAVDLAWHTNQLSPASYYSYSLDNTGNIFIDHDDRIEEGVRTNAFEWTGEQYKQLTKGGNYGQCLCWYCTAANEHVFSSGGWASLHQPENSHVDIEANPELKQKVLHAIAKSQYEKLEEDFNLACKDAEQHCQPRPDQKEYLENYKWLYTAAIPIIGG